MSKPPRRWVLEALVLSSGRRAVFGYGSAVLMSCWGPIGPNRARVRAGVGAAGVTGWSSGAGQASAGGAIARAAFVGGLEGGRGGQAGGQTQDDAAGVADHARGDAEQH